MAIVSAAIELDRSIEITPDYYTSGEVQHELPIAEVWGGFEKAHIEREKFLGRPRSRQLCASGRSLNLIASQTFLATG